MTNVIEKKTGKKLDEGKAPVMTGVFLLFPRSMYELAKVSKLGADKYGVTLPDDNFLYVENGANRYMDAHGRHLLERQIRGDLHTETGGELPPEGVEVSHLTQSVWDGLCVLERTLKDKETSQTDSTIDPQSWWADWQKSRYPSPR